MNSGLNNALTYIWLGGSFFVFVVAIASLIHAIVGWRGPYRRQRLTRFALGLATVPALFAAYLAILWGLLIPSHRHELERRTMEAESLVHVGDTAPLFTLHEPTGRQFSLEALRGKVVLLNFFATWCAPCVEELPHLQEIWDNNRENSDFAMIVVGREETDESVATFQSNHKFTIPMASDPEQAAYSLYAKRLLPRTYLISRQGEMCFLSDFLDDEDLSLLRKELAVQLQ